MLDNFQSSYRKNILDSFFLKYIPQNLIPERDVGI